LIYFYRNSVFPQDIVDEGDRDNIPMHVQVVNNQVAVNDNVLLSPHDQKWVNIGGPVVVDVNMNNSYPHNAAIHIPDQHGSGVDCTPLDFFYMMFPMNFLISRMVPYTNQELLRRRRTLTTEGEMIRFLGLTLAMAIDPCRGGLPAYWENVDPHSEIIFTGRHYGTRFGMSRNRFLELRSYMRCAPSPQENDYININGVEQDKDPWQPIRLFIAAFNGCRKSVMKPGPTLVVDEVMSMWYGLESQYSTDGMPHVTKIQRKPRGVGVEMKALCDGQSNIMLQLEIMEGATRQAAKMFHDTYGSGTSITLRLCIPWRGSGRTIIGDSAFASVKTLEALHKELGLYFMGMVKTASRRYPKLYLQKWFEAGWDPNPRRELGSWITLQVITFFNCGNVLDSHRYCSLTTHLPMVLKINQCMQLDGMMLN
jgi:hypothetical protein